MFDLIVLQIGAKGNLTKHKAKKMGLAFRVARSKYPESKIAFSIDGYDDDPREIYQIPEACEYIKLWAKASGFDDWRTAIGVPWADAAFLALLQLSGVFGSDSPIEVRTETMH